MTDETLNVDRRVQRTRNALRAAMISLLQERSWDDINIQLLCERADIGRSTFYLHYQNKEELLVSSFNDLRTMLRAQAAQKHADSDSFRFVSGLIEHVYEQRTIFRAVIGRGSGHVVQKRFREMLNQLVEEENLLPVDGWKRVAGARYIAGALIGLLSWWIDTNTECSAEEIETLFYQLTLPGIKSQR